MRTEKVKQRGSPEMPEKLPEIVERLETEFMPLWKDVCERRMFADIEGFAHKVRAAGKELSCEMLVSYGERLTTHSHNFDVENMKPVLYSYPDLIRKLRGQMNADGNRLRFCKDEG